MRSTSLAGALFVLASSVSVLAQSTTQSIQGIISDSSGAVMSGAKVTVTNVDTGIVRTIETNATGNYSFPLLQVGNYDIRVEMQGFKTEEARSVRVETAAQLRLDFSMEVGSISEVVEVSAANVTLNTENPTVGGVIENKRIIDLPLNGRNVTQLAVLVPGVQFGDRTGRGDGLGGFPIPGSGFSVSANGQRETHQVVSLDGVDAKDPRIHITNFVPSIEAIEEFKIQTNAYSAEVGFGGGANVQITMKSGTNKLHGTLFEFVRNDIFDAENYFLNFGNTGTRRKKDALRRNQFGFVVSGPVTIPKIYDGKNKTFWAFNMEYRLDRVEAVQQVSFPIDAFRQGDFSKLLAGTINPQTGRLFRNPIVIFDAQNGLPFANNVIPRSRLHPGALNVLEKYVPRARFDPVDPLDFTAIGGVNQPINARTYFARVDHHFSDSDRVFARLALDRSDRQNNDINPGLPVFVDSKVSNLATQWIHTFSPTTINELRVGFNISDDLTSNPRTDDASFDMDALGVGEVRVFGDGNRKLTPREHGIPQFNGLPFTLRERTNGNGYDNMDTIQIGNHISMFRGKHNLKAGAELYRISMERGAANLEEGAFNFGGNESGYAFASFLLGLPTSTQSAEGLPLTFPRANRWGAYLNDDWKVSSRMTVNLGLRFDLNGVPVDSQGLWRTLNLPGVDAGIGRGQGSQTPNGQTISNIFPSQVNEAGAVRLFKQRVRFFMPRLGITFRPTEKWVLRMGAGWFDNIHHTNTFTIFNLMPPKSGSLLFQSVTDPVAERLTITGADGQPYSAQTRRYRAGQPILTLNDPFLQRTGGTGTVRPVNLLYIPPDYIDGDVWKWSFDLQRELPGQIALTIGYVGSKGSHVGNSIGNFNQAPPSPNTNIQARRPYQQFFDPATPQLGVQSIGNIRYIDSFGENFYHGLQMKADKRFARGLSFGLSYTFSKTHGDGENGGQEGASFQDPLDRRGNRGLYRFDQRHNFVGHYLWELPGQNIQGPAKWIIGGWQMNGILSFRTGFPFTVGGGDLNTGGTVRPDLVGNPFLDNPTRDQWYNPLAFQRVSCNIPTRPDLCHYGSAGYNILRAPGQKNVDLSLFKNFRITESVNVQFRVEAVNAFNTPYFGDPGGIGFAGVDQITPNAPRMGEVRGLRTPMRIMQFGLKLYF
jgi:hypothetical protein